MSDVSITCNNKTNSFISFGVIGIEVQGNAAAEIGSQYMAPFKIGTGGLGGTEDCLLECAFV